MEQYKDKQDVAFRFLKLAHSIHDTKKMASLHAQRLPPGCTVGYCLRRPDGSFTLLIRADILPNAGVPWQQRTVAGFFVLPPFEQVLHLAITHI